MTTTDHIVEAVMDALGCGPMVNQSKTLCEAHGSALWHYDDGVCSAAERVALLVVAEGRGLRDQVAELTVALREANDARADLLAHIGRLHEAVKTVKAIHGPVEALNVRYDRVQKVCTGCGTDDGNWQTWPCPTIKAIEAAGGAS